MQFVVYLNGLVTTTTTITLEQKKHAHHTKSLELKRSIWYKLYDDNNNNNNNKTGAKLSAFFFNLMDFQAFFFLRKNARYFLSISVQTGKKVSFVSFCFSYILSWDTYVANSNNIQLQRFCFSSRFVFIFYSKIMLTMKNAFSWSSWRKMERI